MIVHTNLYGKIYQPIWIGCMITFCLILAFGMQIPTLLGKWGTYSVLKIIKRSTIQFVFWFVFFFSIFRSIQTRSEFGHVFHNSWWTRSIIKNRSVRHWIRYTVYCNRLLLHRYILGRSRVSYLKHQQFKTNL